jgi:DnaK suppressor protein
MAFAQLAEPFPFESEEPYMAPAHLEYFREKLLDLKERLYRKLSELTRELQHGEEAANELLDRAQNDRFRSTVAEECIRYRRLVEASDAALVRIADGSFGYCMETGEEIGLRRLEAVPYAALCVQAQERLERGISR